MHIPESITKAPILFLTGAGASAPLGLHPTRDFLDYFTSQLLNQIDTKNQPVLGDLILQIRILAAAGGIDIERILGVVEQNVADVGHLMSDPTFMKTVLYGSAQAAASFKEANEVVRDFIYKEVITHYSEVGVSAAASLYRDLFLQFKHWMIEVPRVGTTIPFFTLNYDLAVETAATELRVPLVDGLRRRGAMERRWSQRAFEVYKQDPDKPAVVLMKLHGSVKWGRRTASSSNKGENVIVELPPGVGRNPGVYTHVVLYPSETAKPIHEEPFRTLYRIFRTCLNNASVLFVLGCSLRDQEIRISISDGMDDNRALHVVLIGPDADHNAAAAELGVDRARVAAAQIKLELPIGSNFMTLLQGFAYSAAGVQPVSGPGAFRFDTTYKTWPWVPQAID